ncbi:hypothetical protein [Dactylosporangium sp. CA-092794]|uniref:hypothetical protein n=1 Tax=Dactylosporangium sp. CA-092794 TaxID=3239929 RepID=UPI003D912F21
MALSDYGRHLLLAVDVRGYGRSDDRRQHEIQRQLAWLLDTAAARAGLDRPSWQRQAAGDGELAVLPDSEPEPRLVDGFVRELAAELMRGNAGAPPAARLRMRVAVHHGVVRAAAMGFSGKGVVEVSRLADSRVAHLALDRAGGDLVLVVSERVFADTVEQPHTSYDPAAFRAVTVEHKELRQTAWLLVPGHDLHSVDLEVEPAAVPEPRPPSRVSNNASHVTGPVVQAGDIHGDVTLGDWPDIEHR